MLDNVRMLQVRMESLKGCQLGIGMYPTFSYNASGGGGIATVTPSAESPSRVDMVFDPAAVTIPDVTYSTARVGGVPLLPVFRIRVQPESLQVLHRPMLTHSVALSLAPNVGDTMMPEYSWSCAHVVEDNTFHA